MVNKNKQTRFTVLSPGQQEILRIQPPCANPVLKATGYHTSWRYYRNNALKMSR